MEIAIKRLRNDHRHTHRHKDIDLGAQLGDQPHDNLIRVRGVCSESAQGIGELLLAQHKSRWRNSIRQERRKARQTERQREERERERVDNRQCYVLACATWPLPAACPDAVHFRR